MSSRLMRRIIPSWWEWLLGLAREEKDSEEAAA
jgi:hypothetical protein